MNATSIRAMPLIQWLLAALLMLLLAACAASPVPIGSTPARTNSTRQPAGAAGTPANSAEPTTRPRGSKVSVGDHELYLRCVGEGSPTVIIEPELATAGTSSNWGVVTQELGLTTRVCVYDRANLGRSDTVDSLRTSEDVAADLDNLLESAEIEPPYILVADAFGSWHARVFAQQHPDDVAGMVLVSPSHPDFFERLLEALPPAAEDETEFITLTRDYWSDPTQYFDEAESLDYTTSAEQVRKAESFGDLPIIILSLKPAVWTVDSVFPPDIFQEIEQVREALQAEHLSLSTNSEQRIVDGVEYFIQQDNPHAIVDAALALIEGAR